ncbi:hypothetical protein H7100_02765 [Candidatus Saccharibacteria bacterium]|nr:hypothetical protein [Candidatus Saccharibacteria bacterium]
MAGSNEYIPGMCNIGPSERRMRRLGGIAGSVVTVVILGLLIHFDAPTWWRLILIIPAAGAATGFLQDRLHFCVGFGMKGIYNVINSAGVVDNVELEEYRLKDKKKAQQIVIYSGLIGLAVGLLSLLIP